LEHDLLEGLFVGDAEPAFEVQDPVGVLKSEPTFVRGEQPSGAVAGESEAEQGQFEPGRDQPGQQHRLRTL
jgi:hypothetical protein